MATVSETLDLPGGSSPDGVTVSVVLAGSGGAALPAGYGSVAGTTIIGSYSPTVTAGAWTLDLPRNDQITPTGTVWKIVLSGAGVSTEARYVDVDGAGPFDVADILTDAPATIDTSTYAALDARVDALEAYDTLSAELPLTLTDLGNGTTELRARGVPRLIHSFTPGAAVASTATEGSLATTFDTAADELAEGDVLMLEAWGTLENDDAQGDPHTTTYRLRGDTLVAAAANANLVADASTTRTWRFVATILIGASGALNSTGFLSVRGALAAASDTTFQTVQDSTATLDLAQPITWDLTADHDEASATLTTTLLGALLWHVKV